METKPKVQPTPQRPPTTVFSRLGSWGFGAHSKIYLKLGKYSH